MASKTLFRTVAGKLLPKTDTVNEAGGRAYRFGPRHALAQYAATGCLNSTYYAADAEQLENTLALCDRVEASFLAKTAIYARQKGYMKDMPALLASVLATKDGELLAKVFPRVIDHPKMLRNFVQIMRSGLTGRKSLGSRPKRLVRQWLAGRSDEQLFVGSVGKSPSLADVVKMVHPRPATASRAALYAYLIGRQVDAAALPPLVREYERFKADPTGEPVPDVPFQLLTSLPLEQSHWVEIARRAPWQMTRMNLNTFARHGVFDVDGLAEVVAARLADPELVKRSRVFPYQLFMTWRRVSSDLPAVVREALKDAMEIAISNVPEVGGRVYVLPDVSGSMMSPVTGYRKGSTTSVRCVDVAALVAAAVLRKNPRARVIPFHDKVERVRLDAGSSVMTNARKLASLPSGGTDCSAPLRLLNGKQTKGDLLIYVSDNQSWLDRGRYAGWGSSPTATMTEWARFKRRNPEAKLVCMDVQPYGTTQAQERRDILNVGGFSDQVFRLLADFARGGTDAGYWVQQIESVELEEKVN